MADAATTAAAATTTTASSLTQGCVQNPSSGTRFRPTSNRKHSHGVSAMEHRRHSMRNRERLLRQAQLKPQLFHKADNASVHARKHSEQQENFIRGTRTSSSRDNQQGLTTAFLNGSRERVEFLESTSDNVSDWADAERTEVSDSATSGGHSLAIHVGGRYLSRKKKEKHFHHHHKHKHSRHRHHEHASDGEEADDDNTDRGMHLVGGESDDDASFTIAAAPSMGCKRASIPTNSPHSASVRGATLFSADTSLDAHESTASDLILDGDEADQEDDVRAVEYEDSESASPDDKRDIKASKLKKHKKHSRISELGSDGYVADVEDSASTRQHNRRIGRKK